MFIISLGIIVIHDRVELPPLCIKVIDTPQFHSVLVYQKDLKEMTGVLVCEMYIDCKSKDCDTMLLTTKCIHVFDRSYTGGELTYKRAL